MDRNHRKNINQDLNLSQNQIQGQDLSQWTVNLNESSAQELSVELGWDEDLAMRVVEFRDHNGKFSSWEELRNIPGFETRDLDQFRDRFEF